MNNTFLLEFIMKKIGRLKKSTNDDLRFGLWMEINGFIDGCYTCDKISAEEFHDLHELARNAYTDNPA